jgi:perosamine synthetase
MNPERLAIEGGAPVREKILPYARQSLDAADLDAVRQVLEGDWLTTGPKVAEFEQAVAATAGTAQAVACANGTAALHLAVMAAGVGPGDEVIVPALTFLATANCAVFQGARPVFCDVDPATLLMDPAKAAELVTPQTKALISVDYAGQPCDYPALRDLCRAKGLVFISDACHALGADLDGVPPGELADMVTYSFHPAKHVTTAEGGAVATDSPDYAALMRSQRNHGMDQDLAQRQAKATWYYDMVRLGYNYRLSDLQCALGLSQIGKLPGWLARRRELAAAYDRDLADMPAVSGLAVRPGAAHAYHIYLALLDPARLRVGRDQVFAALRAEGIGVNVHYRPVHLHSFYRDNFATAEGLCPVAEDAAARMLTLPLFPAMSDDDQADVITALHKVLEADRR